MANAIFEIEWNGSVYELEADEDTTEEQFLAFFQSQDQAPANEEKPGWFEGRIASGAATVAQQPAAAAATAIEEVIAPNLAATPQLGAMGFGARDLPGQPGPYFEQEKFEAAKPDNVDVFGSLPETWRGAAEQNLETAQKSMPENVVAKFFTEAVDAGVTMAPSILGAMATGGSSTVAYGLMSIPAFGSGFEEGLKRFDGDADKALAEGFITMAKEVGSEKMFGVFDQFGVSKKVAKELVKLVGREAGSESFTEAIDQIDKYIRFGETQEDWKAALGAIAYAGGLGAMLGGTIGGASTYTAAQREKALDEGKAFGGGGLLTPEEIAAHEAELALRPDQPPKRSPVEFDAEQTAPVQAPLRGQEPELDTLNLWGDQPAPVAPEPKDETQPGPSDEEIDFIWNNLEDLIGAADLGIAAAETKESLRAKLQDDPEMWANASIAASKIRAQQALEAFREGRIQDQDWGEFGSLFSPETSERFPIDDGSFNRQEGTRYPKPPAREAQVEEGPEQLELPAQQLGRGNMPLSAFEQFGKDRNPTDRARYEPTAYSPAEIKLLEQRVDQMSDEELISYAQEVSSNPTETRKLVMQLENGQGIFGTPEARRKAIGTLREQAKADATFVERTLRDQSRTADITREEWDNLNKIARGMDFVPNEAAINPDLQDADGNTVITPEARRVAKEMDLTGITYGNKSERSSWSVEGYDRTNGTVFLIHRIAPEGNKKSGYVRVWYNPFNNTMGQVTKVRKKPGQIEGRVEWDRWGTTDKLLKASVAKYVPGPLRKEVARAVQQFTSGEWKVGRPGGMRMATIAPSYVKPAPSTEEVAERQIPSILKDAALEHRKLHSTVPTDKEIRREFRSRLAAGEIDLATFGIDEASELVSDMRKAKAEATRLPKATETERTLARETALEQVETERELVASTVAASIPDAARWEQAPKLKGEEDLDIATLISQKAMDDMNNGTLIRERAYQILPNGLVRVLEIRATHPGRKYEVSIVSQGRNKVSPAKVIGKAGKPPSEKFLQAWLDMHPAKSVKRGDKVTPTLIEKLHKADIARERRGVADVEETQVGTEEEAFVLDDPEMDRILKPILAKADAREAAQKAEKERRKKLTPEQRKAEDEAKKTEKQAQRKADKKFGKRLDQILEQSDKAKLERDIDKLVSVIDSYSTQTSEDTGVESLESVVAAEEAGDLDATVDEIKGSREFRSQLVREVGEEVKARRADQRYAEQEIERRREGEIDAKVEADKRKRMLGRDGMALANNLLNLINSRQASTTGQQVQNRATQRDAYDQRKATIEAIVEALTPYYTQGVGGRKVGDSYLADRPYIPDERLMEEPTYYEGDRFKLGTGGIVTLSLNGQAQKAAVRRALDAYFSRYDLPADPGEALHEILAVRDHLIASLKRNPDMIEMPDIDPRDVISQAKRIQQLEDMQLYVLNNQVDPVVTVDQAVLAAREELLAENKQMSPQDIIQFIVGRVSTQPYYGPGRMSGEGNQPFVQKQLGKEQEPRPTPAEEEAAATEEPQRRLRGVARPEKAGKAAPEEQRGLGRTGEGTRLPEYVEGGAQQDLIGPADPIERVATALRESIEASSKAQIEAIKALQGTMEGFSAIAEQKVSPVEQTFEAAKDRASQQAEEPELTLRELEERSVGLQRSMERLAEVEERVNRYVEERQKRRDNARANAAAARTQPYRFEEVDLGDEIASIFGETPQQGTLNFEQQLEQDTKTLEEARPEVVPYVAPTLPSFGLGAATPITSGKGEVLLKRSLGSTQNMQQVKDAILEKEYKANLSGKKGVWEGSKGSVKYTKAERALGKFKEAPVPFGQIDTVALGRDHVKGFWRTANRVIQDETGAPDPRVMSLDAPTLDEAAEFNAWLANDAIGNVAPTDRTTKLARKSKYLAKLLSKWNKNYGAGNKIGGRLRQYYEQVNGMVQGLQERAMDGWALARQAMPGAWNSAKDKAVNHYLQGMSRESAADLTGYEIPDAAIPHLDNLKETISGLGWLANRTGTFQSPNVVASIVGGRAYLSRSLSRDGGDRSKIDANMEQLKKLFNEAFPALTEEQIDEASASRLLHVIRNRMPGVSPNITYPTVEGSKYGLKKEGTVNAIAYVGKDGTTKILALLNEDGGKVIKNGMVATAEELRTIVREHGSKQDATGAINTLVTNLMDSDVAPTATTGQLGPDWKVRQVRSFLKSEQQMITDAVRRLETKETSKKMREKMESYKGMHLNQVLDDIVTRFPELAEEAKQIRAEYTLNSELRDLLGEIQNPDAVLSQTVDKLASSIGSAIFATKTMDFLRAQGLADFKSHGEGWVLLAPEGSKLASTNFIANVNAVQAEGQQTPGTKRLGEVYVPSQIAEAIKGMTGYGKLIDNGFMRGMRKANSLTKKGKVVWNLFAHPRNLVSTGGIHAATSMLGTNSLYAHKLMFGAAAGQAKLALGQWGRAWKENKIKPSAKRLEKVMLKHNLYYDGTNSAAIYEILKKEGGLGAEGIIQESKGRFMDALNSLDDATMTAFRLEDEAVKGAALITYASEELDLTGHDVKLIEKYFEGKPMSKEDTALVEKALEMAAEHVKNTYPTFSRAPEFVKWLSRNLFFGAFPTFSSEMLRNTAHIMYNNMRAVQGYTPGGQKIVGAKRIKAASMATLRTGLRGGLYAGAYYGAKAVSAMALQTLLSALGNGGDDEELVRLLAEDQRAGMLAPEAQRRMRGALPFFKQNSAVSVIDIDRENGTFRTVDFGYLSPYGAMLDVQMKWQAEVEAALEAGVDSPEFDATLNAMWGFANIFTNQEPLMGSLIKRLQNKPSGRVSSSTLRQGANVTDKGISDWMISLPMFEETDILPNVFGAIGGTVVQSLPEFTGQVWDAVKFVSSQAETDDEKMELADWAMVAAGTATGAKVEMHKITETLPAALHYEIPAYSKSTSNFKKGIVKAINKSEDEFYEAFKKGDGARRVLFNGIQERIDVAVKVYGLNVNELRQMGVTFKAPGGTPFNRFYFNKYQPLSLGDMMQYAKDQDVPYQDRAALAKKYSAAYRRWMEENR